MSILGSILKQQAVVLMMILLIAPGQKIEVAVKSHCVRSLWIMFTPPQSLIKQLKWLQYCMNTRN